MAKEITGACVGSGPSPAFIEIMGNEVLKAVVIYGIVQGCLLRREVAFASY